MQRSSYIPAGQRLDQAWARFTQTTNPEEKQQSQLEMIALLKEQILSFTPEDAPKLREIANSISNLQNVNPELTKRITELAADFESFSSRYPLSGAHPIGFSLIYGLPEELLRHVLRFVPPVRRFGINCCNADFGAESIDPKKLAKLINRPDHPIPLDRLPKLLSKCGHLVVELDFSRLLTLEDRALLDQVQLARLIALCPNLQSLTLFGSDKVSNAQLIEILKQAHARASLQDLNIAGCLGINDPQPLQVLTTDCPLLRPIGFVPYGEIYHFNNLLKSGMRLRRFFRLPDGLRKEIVLKKSEISHLMQNGMSLKKYCQILDPKKREFITDRSQETALLFSLGLSIEEFCYISQTQREALVQNKFPLEQLRYLKNFNISALARLSSSELTNIFSNVWLVKNLIYAGLPFVAFCEYPAATKDLLLDRQFNRTIIRLLKCNVTPDQFLALPPALKDQFANHPEAVATLLDGGLPWDQLVQMPWDNRQALLDNSFAFTCLKKWITPIQWTQLALPILQLVLREQMTIGMLLDVGMNLDVFCTLPEAARARVMANYSHFQVLMQRGDRLETLLQLEDAELKYIFNNMKGFSSITTIAVPSFMRGMPLFQMLMRQADARGVIRNPSQQMLSPEVEESQGLSILHDTLGAAFTVAALPDEQRAAQMQSETFTVINDGIPLERFVELRGALRQKVLKHADKIGERIQAGMKFEEFLAMTEAEQDELLK